jgi:hypothetical protein
LPARHQRPHGQYTVTCSFAFDEAANDTGPAKPVVKSSFPLTILIAK